MPRLRFIKTRPFLVLAAVILAWLVLPVAVKRLVQASFFEFLAPFEVSASYVRDLQDYWALRTRPKNEIIEAARDLARLNASYEIRLRENEALRTEIARLEELLRLPSRPAHRYEVARVVRRDFSGWWNRLIIRKGRNHGIAPGSAVVFAGGVVGRVSEVGAYTSTVNLLSSPGFRAAVVVEGDSRPLSYQGGHNPTLGPSGGRVDYVPLDILASRDNPRTLVTSGLGGVFPPGLPVGRIVELEPAGDGLFKSGIVELDSRLMGISEIAVLVPILTPGTEVIQ